MFKRIHVYDLDGVLVDSSHRYRNLSTGAIDLAHWRENRTAENIAKDRLLNHALQYVGDCLNPNCYVIICTAREHTENDVNFINNVLGAPDELLMRPANNWEGDATLKRRQLQRVFNLQQFHGLPRTLWEDNPINIDRLGDLFTHTIHVPSNQGV